MSKENPFLGDEETEKQLTNQARENLIRGLEEAREFYGPDWVNRENTDELLEDLRQRKSTTIGGPFFSEHLDGVLCDLGIKSGDGTGRYEAIRKRLEKGDTE